MTTDALASLRRLLPPPLPSDPSPDENRARLKAAATLMRRVRLDERHAEALTLGGESAGIGPLYTPSVVHLRQAFWLIASAIACTLELIATAKAEGADTMRLHRHRVELIGKAMEMLDTYPLEIAAFLPTHAAGTATASPIGTPTKPRPASVPEPSCIPTRTPAKRSRKRPAAPDPKPQGSA